MLCPSMYVRASRSLALRSWMRRWTHRAAAESALAQKTIIIIDGGNEISIRVEPKYATKPRAQNKSPRTIAPVPKKAAAAASIAAGEPTPQLSEPPLEPAVVQSVKAQLKAVMELHRSKQLRPGEAADKTLPLLRDVLAALGGSSRAAAAVDAFSVLEVSLQRIYDDSGGDVGANLAALAAFAAEVGAAHRRCFTSNQACKPGLQTFS